MKQLLFLLLLVSAPIRLTAQESPEDQVASAFTDGNMLMDENRFAEALERYRAGLAIDSMAPALLYNSGLAAYRSGDIPTSITLWRRLRALDTNEWQVRTKLIQAYQAAGDTTARDIERAGLFALRASGTDTILASRPLYVRDQFVVAGREIMAMEQFELTGERAVRYAFLISDSSHTKIDYRISLGSYESTNAMWRELEKRGADERIFHLDGYYDWGHATFGMFNPEPGYDQVRAMIVDIIEGRREAISSSRRRESK
jgi:tetratricopeptide (TPR) repeat protein